MAKIKYLGDDRRTITWTTMGQAFTYFVNPGQIISIEDKHIPYVLSFGSFKVLEEGPVVGAGIAPRSSRKPQGRRKPEIFIEAEAAKIFEKVAPKATPEVAVEAKPEVQPEVKVEVKPEPVAPVTEVVEEEPEVEEEEITEAPVPEAPVVEKTEEQEAPKKIDYTSFRKAELKKMCQDRALDDKGNRDDLIARLCADDQGVKLL